MSANQFASRPCAELTENAKAGIAAIAMAAVVLLAGLLALLARQKLQPSRHLDRVRSAVRNDAEVIARRT